jgi:Uma2 family endonuclease
MTTAKKLLTADDLMAMPDDGKRYELIRGELIEMPPASHEHGRVAERFGRRIGNFVEDRDLGHTVATDTGIFIEHAPDTVRAPDHAFISYARMAGPPPSHGYAEVVPDLVVEVVSPNDRQPDIDAKTQMWLNAGVLLVLVAYPETREVYAHHEDGSVIRYGNSDTVVGDPVLPGFTCPVSDIFAFGPRQRQRDN